MEDNNLRILHDKAKKAWENALNFPGFATMQKYEIANDEYVVALTMHRKKKHEKKLV